MSRKSYVYLITNTVNGMRYVGKSVNPYARWRAHRSFARAGSRVYLYEAMRKHGLEHFSFRVVAEYPTDAEALTAERLLIAELKTKHRDVGYNLSDGGEHSPVGFTHTPEARARIRAAVSARVVTQETRDRLSKALTGKKYGPPSDAQRAVISAVHKGRKQSTSQVANRVSARRANGTYKLSDENRLRMTKMHLGTKLTAEHKEKIGAAQRGRKYTPEQIAVYRVAAQQREDRNRCARWYSNVMAGVEPYAT